MQLPASHVPGTSYTSSMSALVQALGGGALQVTPRHGSLLQLPFEQPLGQSTSDVA